MEKILLSIMLVALVMSALLFSEHIEILLISLLNIILLLLLWFSMQKKWNSNKRELEKEYNQNIIKTMSIYRHNWLNNMQIILGYLSLKKYDQISTYIQKINFDAQKRSMISSSKNADLAVFIHTIPVKYPKLSYEMEISDDIKDLEDDQFSKKVLNTLKEFLDIFYKCLDNNIDHHLYISFAANKEAIILTFEFEGNIEEHDQEIKEVGEMLQKENGNYHIDLHNEKEFIVEVNLSKD